MYAPATGTWTATDDLNTVRAFHTATLLDGKVLVAEGDGGNGCLNSSAVYLPIILKNH